MKIILISRIINLLKVSLKKLTENDWERIIKIIIFVLTGIFIFIVVVIATDSVRVVGFPLVVSLVFAYFLLGLALLILTLKRKVKGKLGKFLFLTGGSSMAFLISVLLHNFLYAGAVLASNIKWLHFLLEILHAGFFLIGIIVCPLVFLVGIVGSLLYYIKFPLPGQ